MDAPSNPSGWEETLAGGLVSAVAKVGDTVRRSTGPWTPAVHALLRYLKAVGFDGRGREVLSCFRGDVPLRATPEVVTDQALY